MNTTETTRGFSLTKPQPPSQQPASALKFRLANTLLFWALSGHMIVEPPRLLSGA